jgi:hypothetical protein
MALSREQLGAVEAKRLDPYEHFARLRHGNGPVLDLQGFGSTGCVKHDRLHHWGGQRHLLFERPGAVRRLRNDDHLRSFQMPSLRDAPGVPRFG